MATVEQVRDEFITECKNIMGFLVTEHGFSEPVFMYVPLLAQLTYCKRDVGVECGCDIRDKVISVYLVRLENGKLPEIVWSDTRGFLNKKGEVVKAYIFSLIENYVNIPVNANGISQRQANFRSWLLSAKHTLIEHGKSVLDGSADVFINPPPPTRAKIGYALYWDDYEQVVALYKSMNPVLLDENDKNRLASAVIRVREKTESAWKNTDYKQVVRLYELIADYLTDEERDRLDYAKRKL